MLSLGSFRELRNNIQSTLKAVIAFSEDSPTTEPQHLITAVLIGIADGENTAIGADMGGLATNSDFEQFISFSI